MATDDRTVEIEQLLRRGELEPHTHTFARLADLFRQAGKHERALGLIQDGLKDHPYYLDARLLHARVLLELEREEEARVEFEHILTLDPGNPLACMALGVERAETEVDDADGVATIDEWLERLEEAWRTEDTETRTAPGEGGTRAAPARPKGIETATLARLYARQGLFDRAIGVYEHMLSRDPENPDLMVALAEMRHRAEEMDGPPATSPMRRPAPHDSRLAAPDHAKDADRAEMSDQGGGEGAVRDERPAAAMADDRLSIREQLGRILDGKAPAGSN